MVFSLNIVFQNMSYSTITAVLHIGITKNSNLKENSFLNWFLLYGISFVEKNEVPIYHKHTQKEMQQQNCIIQYKQFRTLRLYYIQYQSSGTKYYNVA